MNKKKILCLLLTLLICANIVSPAFAAKQDNIIYIDSIEDFLSVSKNCSLDTWSQGKTFILTSNIDLSGQTFLGIPTFGGSFDGQNHTIKGFTLDESISAAGLFGTIQRSGTVKNLNVTGNVIPAGTQEQLGGIAGVSHGSIEHCSFTGTVSGANYIGGIAGRNESSGVITGCTTYGIISGTHFTGGIVGINSGIVTACVNNSAVNTDSVDESLSLEDIQIDWEQLRSAENVTAHTDTGGIAGYSTGTIENSSNYGAVGYPHVGYNVGGIAGRQSGYMNGCVNHGVIHGRKDVGGIVGQMTPDINLVFSQNDIQNLQSELDILEGLIDKTLTDAESSGADVSAEISNAADYLTAARESTGELNGQLSGFVNDNIEAVNAMRDVVQHYMGELSLVLEPLTDAADFTSDAFSEVSEIVTQTDGLSSLTDDALLDLEKSSSQLRTAASHFASGAASLRSAVTALGGDISLPDIAPELTQLEADAAALVTSLNQLADEIDAALAAYRETGIVSPETAARLLSEFSAALNCGGNVAADLLVIIQKVDWSQLGGISDNVRLSLTYLSQAMQHFRDGFEEIGTSLGYLEAFFRDLRAVNDKLSPVSEQIETALNTLSSASASLSDAIAGLDTWVSDFSDENVSDFSALSDEYSESSERLNAALNGFSGVITTLNDKISVSSSTLTQDLKDLNHELVTVMNLMLDAIESIGEADEDGFYEDISDDVIEACREGKVSSCINHGTVDGDVNIGGITGSMAIEYDLDPEDDITTTGTRSHSFKYHTQAILLGCINDGAITAKKNCSGGMVGRMDLGTVSGCESYGYVSSTSGDYVGGIAGQSLSTIRKSSAKCALSGRRYVAGIAGSGENIYDCCTMVKVEDDAQNTGAIAGEVSGSLSGNRFVSDTLAGVDRISIAGETEPVTYDELLALDGLPEPFRSLVVTFVAEDVVVDAITLHYGDCLDAADIPTIPAKDGYYGMWNRADFLNFTFDEIIEAEYSRYYNTLAGDLLRENGQAAILVEGTFLHEDKLSVIEEGGSFSVVIPDDGTNTHLLRYRPADGTTQNTEIRVLQGGQWERVSCEIMGSYLLFEAEGSEVVFTEVKTRPAMQGLYILICAIAAALICIICLRSRKKRKLRASRQS